MNKVERLRNTLAGNPVDRPPFSVWYHFGNQHASPERTAQAHLEFYDYYDLDFLKVMNDYDYPMPAKMDSFAGPDDLKRIQPFNIERSPLGNQLRALEYIAKGLRGTALFVDTLFNAWNTIRRSLVKDALPGLMADHPQELLEALGTVNRTLIQYALASLERGAAGIFFSVPASAEFLTREQYEKFMRPFDLEFFDALREKGEMHILHAHGESLYFDRLLDYPVHVISWADLNGGPSIAEAREKTSLALMTGLDHVRFVDLSIRAVKEQVKAALARGGNTKFILTPGCSLPTYSFTPLIKAACSAVRGQ